MDDSVRYRMVMVPDKRRLGPDDWVAAGLAALGEGGPDAVAIEPLAVRLGSTKGSGYWHWSSRAALLEAVLERWHQVATLDVIKAVEAAGGSARDRLQRLLGLVTSSMVDQPGQLLVLVHADAAVRAVVHRATVDRIAYVRLLLQSAGIAAEDADRRAVLAYAAYAGYVQLAAITPEVLPSGREDRQALQQTLIDLVLPPSR